MILHGEVEFGKSKFFVINTEVNLNEKFDQWLQRDVGGILLIITCLSVISVTIVINSCSKGRITLDDSQVNLSIWGKENVQ